MAVRNIRRGRALASVAGAALLLATAGAPACQAARAAHRLSAAGDPASSIDASEPPEISPDGKWVVYIHDPELAGGELFAVHRWGGTPVRLSALLPSGSQVWDFRITADSRWVVYSADQDTAHVLEVYAVPIAGPASAVVKMSPALVAGERGLLVSASTAGGRVLSTVCTSTVCSGIWSSPVDGSGAPQRITDAMAADRTISTSFVTPDGERLVYLCDRFNLGHPDLWTVPVDGSAAPVKLNPALDPGGEVHGFLVAPDSSRVVYSADELVAGRVELFTVPALGPSGAVQKLNGALVAGGNVQSFDFSPDGQWIVYEADENVDEKLELFSVPADGSTAAQQLNASLVAAGDVEDFYVDAVSQYVVYRADALVDGRDELFSVPIDGTPAAAVRLNADLPPGGAVLGGLPIDDPERMVIYLADQVTAGQVELWAAPVDGSAAAHAISGSLVSGGDVTGQLAYATADHARIVFVADRLVDERYDVFSTPVDGSEAPTLLDYGATNPNGDVTSLITFPARQEVVYRADRAADEKFNLYVTQTVSPTSQALVNPAGLAASDVFEDPLRPPLYPFTPDGVGILFVADLEVDGREDLWIADELVFEDDFETGGTSEWTSAVP